MQVMEAAVSYYDLNDERYCRLRHILNTKLTASGQLDHFYATRHGGQFIFHVSPLLRYDSYTHPLPS